MKVNAKSKPKRNGTPVGVRTPSRPQSYLTPEQQRAQEDAMARSGAGANELTSVGGPSPEKTEFEGR